ncbi:Uu.00g059120.m01.CDS01 [Anthostomella pinea]|uniref:Uu.00g059120.m01.CDS01 n=1 Tax=Anthostomella pinea TaxID=933095 RepID=A0AAI8VS07_9PEZI|nr:Uu.00g059120.m01.CDS01 [Anthostomella pinea]
MPYHKRAELLEAATAFCTSFANKASPDKIMGHFARASPPATSTTSTSTKDSDILALEHGLPQLAPFLGREFRGRAGVAEYFEAIGTCLTYEDMRFGDYVVDAVEGRVAVRGSARFTWTATGQSWDETFAYKLAFDEGNKVVRYEVWADSGAAYLASKGGLDRVMDGS